MQLHGQDDGDEIEVVAQQTKDSQSDEVSTTPSRSAARAKGSGRRPHNAASS